MKHLAASLMLLLALLAAGQNNNNQIPLNAAPVGRNFERSAKFPPLSPTKYKSRQTPSRSANIAFYMDYGLLDSLYNEYGPNNGGGTWYRDDQYSFTEINSSLPFDSTNYAAWAFTWFPTIVDFVNNPFWPYSEYPPSEIQMTIDTVYVNLGHVHLSDMKDTITVSIWDYDSFQDFAFDSGAAGGGTILLGQMQLIVDSSILGGTGEDQLGNFVLGTYPFSFANNPVTIPQGHRFIIQLNFNGPYNDEFYLGSARRNDCASTCGASNPYINASFGAPSQGIDSFNSVSGMRYLSTSPPDTLTVPSTFYFAPCNGATTKVGECEDFYTQDFDIFPNIKAYLPNFFVVASANQTDPCTNSSLVLTANGGGSPAVPFTYSWVATSGYLSNSTGQQATLTTSNNAENDTVIATLTDANNQSTSDTLIIVTGGIAIKITNPTQPVTISCGQKVILTTNVSGNILGKNYMWSNGDAGIAASTITDSMAGNFSVTVTNAEGCSASAEVTVNYSGTYNNVSFTPPGQGRWAGCNLVFTNTSTYYLPPWQGTFNGDGAGDDNVPANSQYFSYTYVNPGVYYATLTMDSAGCSFSYSQEITITALPINQTCNSPNQLSVTLGANQTICGGNSITLDPVISGGEAPYVYSWSNTGSALSCYNCTYPFAIVTQNSGYNVTVTDAIGATATASVYFNVSGSSSMSLSLSGTNISCANPVDTTTAIVYNGNAPYMFEWGDNSSSSGYSPVTHLYTSPGTFVVSVTDNSGCVTSGATTVNNAGVNVSLLNQVNVKCLNGSTGELIVAGAGGAPPYNYSWSTGSHSNTLTNLSTGYYTVIVTDANSCSGTATYYLGAIDWNFYVYLEPTDANCSNNGSIEASVYGGIPPFSYNWNNNDTTGYITGLAGGNYTLTVQDSLGCQANGAAFVTANCNSIVSGTVFTDLSGTCSYNNNDPGVGGVYIEIYNNNQSVDNYAVTDANGKYSISVPYSGSYTIQYNDYYAGCAASLCPTSLNITITNAGDSSANNNFGLTDSAGTFDLGIHPGWTSADPGFQKEYWVFYYNNNYRPYIGNATIIFNYDSNLIYENSVPPVTYDQATHTLSLSVDSVPSLFNEGWTQIVYYFMVPASLSTSYLLQSDFTILPVAGDCDPSDNHYHYSENVLSSHDPNEKDVSPATYVNNDSVLTYTIHFQNNGTDSTNFIAVIDTLSSELNPATVRTIASSSPNYQFSVSGPGILKWLFNPYHLVDSAANPGGSKGFIMFTVEPRSNRQTGAVISNTATIYFDYNTGVTTNTVTDTVAALTSITALSLSQPEVTIFPNPASTMLYITANFTAQQLTIFDVNGKRVSEQKFVPQVDISQLATGIYFIEVKGENADVRKKVVKLSGE